MGRSWTALICSLIFIKFSRQSYDSSVLVSDTADALVMLDFLLGDFSDIDEGESNILWYPLMFLVGDLQIERKLCRLSSLGRKMTYLGGGIEESLL